MAKAAAPTERGPDPSQYDFHLRPGFRCAARGSPAALGDVPLVPREQYLHPMGTEPVPEGVLLSPGAFQT
jgi:hypothetical protein